MVAKTIGTKVSFAWETVAGQRPTTGYKIWNDCISHPDFNVEPDQIETTTLTETYMHTYEDGLYDFGSLEFGANMTPDTYTLVLGADGFATQYPSKSASNLRLWVCVEIANFPKAFFVPVNPSRNGFGLPGGESGSNKYDLVVRFTPASSSIAGASQTGWYDAPTYDSDTNYVATVTGYAQIGTNLKVFDRNDVVVRNINATATSTEITLVQGEYYIVATFGDNDPQIQVADLTSGNATVTFEAFTE